uniref:C2H2-type domain-containing protein n=1 Tax=Astyanax mexicanus TaxID=7994 RepID=A0A8B9JFR1_ASTMX
LDKPHGCPECGKSFKRRTDLRIHLHRIHTGDMPYQCSTCGKSFNHQLHLEIHHRTHTGEKPYSCSQCGKRFNQKCHLLRHERFHAGEKPFQCSECGRSFSLQSHLQAHNRNQIPNKSRKHVVSSDWSELSKVNASQKIRISLKRYFILVIHFKLFDSYILYRYIKHKVILCF